MKRILICSFALFALAVHASPAIAGKSYKSKVTIEFMPGKRVDAFGGYVTSERKACVEGRKVSLYKQEKRHSDPIKVGSSDVSRDNGFWGVEHTPEARFYFAKAKSADVSGGTCESATSKLIKFND